MSGIDVENDVILEVAAIASDWNFQEIATFEAVIKQDERLIRTQMAKAKDVWNGNNFWDENPDARDGLLGQNENGQTQQIVEKSLIKFINTHFASEQLILLAGNSIHNDRRFIAKYMPMLEAKLHYRMLDVTAWKLVFENKFHKKFSQPKEHRALDDVRRSIRELEHYLKKVKL